MDIRAFKVKYEQDKPILLAWGEFVTEDLQKQLASKLNSNITIEKFLKIPPSPRIKSIDSLISKAFYRGKAYDDPYNQITDKVGTRFVVLLLKDIRLIQSIVEESDRWSFSKDRDFEEERRKNPLSFDYQSVHYILKSRGQIHFKDIDIPENICCELQIRTLLQHAYCELTHDTIYKPTTKTSPDVARAVSKSMALIETTDSIFEDVDNTLSKASEVYLALLDELVNLYSELVGYSPQFDIKVNIFILETYSELLKSTSAPEISIMMKDKLFIIERIKDRADTNFLFMQPVILLLYKLAYTNRYMMRQKWPFQQEQIAPIFLDLGISI